MHSAGSSLSSVPVLALFQRRCSTEGNSPVISGQFRQLESVIKDSLVNIAQYLLEERELNIAEL